MSLFAFHRFEGRGRGPSVCVCVCWGGGIVVDVAIVDIPQLLGATKLGIGEEGGNGGWTSGRRIFVLSLGS